MHWWLSSERMTVMVFEREGIVRNAPPIVAKFVGQPMENLERWMGRQPGFREVCVDTLLEEDPDEAMRVIKEAAEAAGLP